MYSKQLSPRSVVIALFAAPIFYFIVAAFVPPIILRDFFNPLAFGVFAVIAATWARDAFEGLRQGMATPAWFLIFGVFHVAFVAMSQRLYAMIFVALGRPDWMAEGVFAGFWPYSYLLAGISILYAAGVQEHGSRPQSWATVAVAIFIGGMAAGATLALSISSVI